MTASRTSGRARRWPAALAAFAAWFAGGCGAAALVVAFTVFDDPCPGYDDEGPMVAPGSAYARLMCDPVVSPSLSPMTQVPIPAVLAVAWALAGTGSAWLVVRAGRGVARRHVAAAVTGVLLVQPVLVVAAQYTLPRDCLAGRTTSGECTRDRELR